MWLPLPIAQDVSCLCCDDDQNVPDTVVDTVDKFLRKMTFPCQRLIEEPDGVGRYIVIEEGAKPIGKTSSISSPSLTV